MTFVKAALAGAICMALLSGCAMVKKTEKEVDDDHLNVEQLKQRMSDGAASSAVLTIPRSKLAGEEIVLKEESSLPPLFSRSVMYSTSGQRLDEVLASLSRQIGMPVWLTEFAAVGGASSYATADDGGLGATEIQLQWSGSLSGLLDQLAQASHLHWRFNEGRVEFFLYETRHFYVSLPMGARTISANISGRGQNGASTLERNSGTGDIGVSTGNMSVDPYNALTRTIAAILMENDGSAAIIGSGGSGGTTFNSDNAGGGGSAKEQEVRSGSGGGSGNGSRSRVVVTPEMAMVTVTAPPTSLDRVADYIERVNQRFAKNVMIDVKIYDVSLNENASAGFSADVLYKKLGDYGLQMAGGSVGVLGATAEDMAAIAAREAAKIAAANAIAAAAGTTVTNTVIDPVTGATNVVTTTTAPTVLPQPPYVADAPSRFSGSAALARALESFGKISSVTSGQVMAVNGQPAPLQIATEVTYLASTTTTSGSNSGAGNSTAQVIGESSNISSTLTPGSVVVGLTANFLPQVLGDNRILLQYQLTSSALAGMTTVSSGGSSIQTPTVSSQSLQQQAFVRDGEAIVLFGLEQNASSVTGERAIPATYGRDASKNRTLRVIMLQVFGGGANANNI